MGLVGFCSVLSRNSRPSFQLDRPISSAPKPPFFTFSVSRALRCLDRDDNLIDDARRNGFYRYLCKEDIL